MTTEESTPGENDATGENDVPSTGMPSNDDSVGRVSGDETGDPDESGGDRRAGRPQDAHEGALRDE